MKSVLTCRWFDFPYLEFFDTLVGQYRDLVVDLDHDCPTEEFERLTAQILVFEFGGYRCFYLPIRIQDVLESLEHKPGILRFFVEHHHRHRHHHHHHHHLQVLEAHFRQLQQLQRGPPSYRLKILFLFHYFFWKMFCQKYINFFFQKTHRRVALKLAQEIPPVLQVW